MARTKNLGVIITTIGAALVIPIILGCISNAHAESTDFSITVEPSASITLSSNSVNLEITPTRQGVYRSGSLTVSAATNSPSGYNLVMATTEPDLVSDTLNAATNAYPHIATIAESQNGISAADFEASTDDNILNHWGIAIDSGNFNAMKTSKTIKTTAAAASADVTTVSMASKLNLLTVPGKYSTTINFQITANPLPDTLESAFDKAGKTKSTIGDKQYYKMQDITTVICDDVDVIPSTLEVYDSRDNRIYTIGKLLDNNCWLLDNLALDLTNATVQANLSPSNTNASQEAIDALLSGGRVSGDSSTDRYATSGVAAFSGSGNRSYSDPQIDASFINKTVSDYPSGGDTFSGAENWKFGVYYNYCAATAGSYCYGNGYNDYGTLYDAPNTAIDAEYDICPANWRLPTGGQPNGDGGELYKLELPYRDDSYQYYNGMRAALRLALTGYHDGSGAWMQGTDGEYFSSTVEGAYSDYRAASADGMHVSKTNIDAFSSSGRSSGYNVRCITK